MNESPDRPVDQTLAFEHAGRHFRLRKQAAGRTRSQRARPSNEVWLVEVDGVQVGAFDVRESDSEHQLRTRATTCFRRWGAGR